MMFNAKVAHSQFIAKNELNKASTEMSLKIKLENNVQLNYRKKFHIYYIQDK